jgi:SAM-dependent methyltransferase
MFILVLLSGSNLCFSVRRMIIHKLIIHHLGYRDDQDFYALQAHDAISWLKRKGVRLTARTRVLDLGCGHGTFGLQLLREGCSAIFADEQDTLLPQIPKSLYQPFRIGHDDLDQLGRHDLVVFSNVLEHLAEPRTFLDSVDRLLTEGGYFFLSWTNWLSPWGGHEFSPFHYVGPRRGHLLYDRIAKKQRLHTPFVNLYPTYIGATLRYLRTLAALKVVAVAPRYYPEFAFITRLPILREFLTWNCAVLLQRR